MNRSDIARHVSRETLAVFDGIELLVRKWTPKINIVSRKTLETFWQHHISDGLALVQQIGSARSWVDMGSGGGFPGLVVAALVGSETSVTLIESDARKCAFLKTARRELALNCEIVHGRIEDVTPRHSDIVSARALAALPALLSLGSRHGHGETTYLYPKGVNWAEEEMEARRDWDYELDVIERTTDSGSVILKITKLRKVRA
ncbi:16S rRNA (guanine(527)-N(7))-methyltransferase RsmG [Jannaschia marina]|uniref:16S rRNA (guanine(527)-N(7))-methyltransferase RsmG n=1 Tax=Jannaschia marina TaxID=2741674 RepID=UPI0015CC3C30|nr:16S rRNA (guanine(527)-N(7))-methyltransferase RsmG [Jannaschia marina]